MTKRCRERAKFLHSLTALAGIATLLWARERYALAAEPHFRRVCDPAHSKGGQRCNAWVQADENDAPVRAASPPPGAWGATDLQSAYHLPTKGGGGKIIAAQFGTHYPNAEADLAVYRQQYGLPPCTKANGCFMQVDGTGGTNFPAASACNSLALESSLDIQMLSAGCPDCGIMLIEPNGTQTSGTVKMAVAKGAVAVSRRRSVIRRGCSCRMLPRRARHGAIGSGFAIGASALLTRRRRRRLLP